MWNKYILIVGIILVICGTAYGFRMAKPLTFTHPLDEKQIAELNKLTLDIWNITNGRINVDIVTTSKSGADNGDIWILKTGVIAQIQFKSSDRVYTLQTKGF